MKDYGILTPGEKIKSIRNKFDLKQEDLTGDEITRNLISIIENNKANLTEHTSKILTQSINKICKERNLNFSVTEDYLLEDVLSQSKKIANDYIKYIKNLPVDEIDKIESELIEINVFIKTYDIEELRAELYLEIGLKFRANNLHSKAIDYFLKAYESSRDNKITTKALNRLTSCNIYLSKYNDAINYCKILLDLNSDPQIQFNTKYNLALCYKKLGNHNECIAILNSLIDDYPDIMESSKEKYIATNMLLGSCLNESKAFNKAINLYKDLLKSIPEEYIKEKICIMSNLADVYRATNDCIRLEKICSRILTETKKNISILNEYESYLYLSLAKNIRFINKEIELATDLLLKALENFKNKKCSLYVEDVEKLIIELLSIFINDDDEKNITFLKNEMFELIEKNIFPRANLSSLKFIKYYNFKDNKKEIDNIIDYLAV